MKLFCKNEHIDEAALKIMVGDAVEKGMRGIEKRLDILEKTVRGIDTEDYYASEKISRKVLENLIVIFSDRDQRPEWFVRSIVEQINDMQLKKKP